MRRSGQRYTLTVNDLVYLKENKVPDAVIVAVLESNTPHTPAPAAALVPTATAAAQTAFGPFVRMAGVFRKTSTGSLAVGGDRLEWHDAQSPALSSSLPVSGIRAVWLRSLPGGGQDTVSELCVRTTVGDDVAYRDLDWAGGGEAQVLQLFHALNERFPQLILVEKPRR